MGQVVQISVHGDPTQTSSHPYGPKVKAALDRWEADDTAKWDVIYDAGSETVFDARASVCEVRPAANTLQNVYVPTGPLPQPASKLSDELQWHEDVSALFEWVGMASLGSQR